MATVPPKALSFKPYFIKHRSKLKWHMQFKLGCINQMCSEAMMTKP